jgi:hypothetical protein
LMPVFSLIFSSVLLDRGQSAGPTFSLSWFFLYRRQMALQ